MALEISLAADGNLLLHLPLHVVRLPLSQAGVALLRHILQGQAQGATRLCEQGNPTQFDVDAILKALPPKPLQLAGDRKRWKDIRDKTDVEVRRRRHRPSTIDILEGLDIKELL